MKMRSWKWMPVCLLAVFLISCSSGDEVNNDPVVTIQPSEYTFVQFDVSSGNPANIPLPNDILRNPATGFVAIPPTGDPGVDALGAQINTLQGFSTSGPIIIPMVGGVNASTVSSQTILVLDLVDLAAAQQGAAVDPFRPMRFEVRDEGGNSRIFGFPLRPLQPARPHIVIVTQGVADSVNGLPVESDAITLITKGSNPLLDSSGNSTLSSLSNAQAQQLEPLRQVYQQIWDTASAITSQNRFSIPFAYVFSTQPLFNTLSDLRQKAKADAVSPAMEVVVQGAAQVDGFFSLLGLDAIPHDAIGAVYRGAIDVPYYISDPFSGPFQTGENGVIEVARLQVPFLATMPPGDGPFPAIIFQHGITRSKEDMFAVANSAASVGAGVIAIDLVLHGERTFGIDLMEPIGEPDPSGAYFINLQNLLVGRDNVRQSVSDLYRLTHMITTGAADFDNDGAPELLPQGCVFLGQSLGSIVGSTFVASEANITTANLNVGGARVAYLLQNSDTFGPVVAAGLAGAGIQQGTFLYDLYFLVAQTIFDDADAFNYAAQLSSGNLSGGVATSVLIQEMIGDTVVPNSATRDLALSAGVTQLDAVEAVAGLAQDVTPFVGSGLYQYAQGGHGALLDPTDGPTAAIQLQALTYMLSSFTGTPTVINPFPAAKKPLDFGIGMEVKIEDMVFFPNQLK